MDGSKVELSKTLYFDTSAVNSLARDQDETQEAVFGYVRDRFDGRLVSKLNILEVLACSDVKERELLLRTMRQILSALRPLATPEEILKRSLAAYSCRERNVDWSTTEDGLWTSLHDPDGVSASDIETIRRDKESEERKFREMHENGREALQGVLSRDTSVPRRVLSKSTAYVKWLVEREVVADFIKSLVADYGHPAPTSFNAARFLQDLEPWCFYFGAIGLAIYDRGIKARNYGHRKNPGFIDTVQAVYLVGCSRFVTGDLAQYRLMRRTARMGHIRREVWLYSHLVKKTRAG